MMIIVTHLPPLGDEDGGDDVDDEDHDYDYDHGDDQMLLHLRLRVQQLENSPHSTLQKIL